MGRLSLLSMIEDPPNTMGLKDRIEAENYAVLGFRLRALKQEHEYFMSFFGGAMNDLPGNTEKAKQSLKTYVEHAETVIEFLADLEKRRLKVHNELLEKAAIGCAK